MDPEDLQEKLADPYRVTCPKGHAALILHTRGESAQCQTCKQSYPIADLIDKREATEPPERYR